MADDVLATWINVFKEAKVVCVQETAAIDGYPNLQAGLNANKFLYEPRCVVYIESTVIHVGIAGGCMDAEITLIS